MEVDFAFLADAAEVSNNKLYVIGGAIDTIWVPKIPFVHPHMTFVMRLLFSTAEVGNTHKLEIHIVAADGKRVATIGGNLEIKGNSSASSGRKQGLMTALNIANLKFDSLGDYAFEVVVDNFSLRGVPLLVAQRVPTIKQQ